MKCRVCGCEFDSDRAHCPKCGSKAQEEIKTPNTEEFSWNTYDFPKPQSVSNIDMSWPSMNSSPSDSVTVMSRDASEGYFASENKPSVQPQPQMTWTVPPVQQQQPVYQQPVQQAPVQQPVQQQQPVQPVMQQQPVYQQPVQQPQVQFTAGTWRMPSMQPEPTWTPYNVQAQPVSTQAPQTTPLYVPQFQQPAQPAWTIPPQPQQPVYVAQPAQPVYIQAQPVYQQPVQQAPIQQPVQQQQPVQPVMQQPVYQQVPVYQQPVMQQVPLYMTQPVPSQQMPLQQAPQEPAAGDIPTFGQVAQQAQQAQVPQEPAQQPEKEEMPKAQQPEADKVLEENIVAGAGIVSQSPKYEEEHHVYEPDENGRYPEKFFTFNKKNAEFQQLLDKEYERLRASRNDILDTLDVQPAAEVKENLDQTAVYTKGHISSQQTAAQSFFGAPAVEPSDLSEFEKMLMSGTTDSSESNTLQINQDRIKEAVQQAQPAPVQEEPEPDTRTEHQKKMDAMAAAREAYFSRMVKDDTGRIPVEELKKDPQPAEKVSSAKREPIQPKDFVWTTSVVRSEVAAEAEKAAEPAVQIKEEPAAVAPAKEAPVKQENIKAEKSSAEEDNFLEEIIRELKQNPADEAEGTAPEAEAADIHPVSEEKPEEPEKETKQAVQPAVPVKEAVRREELKKEEPKKEEPKKDEPEQEEIQEERKETKTEKEDGLDALLDTADEEKEDREIERRRRHGFLTFILILIILAALAVGGSIALKIFAPDAEITKKTTQIEETIMGTINGIINKGEKEPADDPVDTGASEHSYDFNGAVSSVNVNIEKVEENLRIAYNPDKYYTVSGLGSSKLVEDPAEKELICKTLVAYNSSWIDYVNGTSTECLDYLKADGAAYRSAANYDKIGQITEVFKSLEVGEMRRSGDSFYAFSREAINVTSTDEDGTTKSADAVSTMIYEMVKIGESLKIVAYYSVD